MTRTILLFVASIGIAPAVLLALANLLIPISSLFSQRRPLSFSARAYFPDGRSFDMEPSLHFSVPTSCLILLGAFLLIFGLSRIRPESPTKPIRHASSSPDHRDV